MYGPAWRKPGTPESNNLDVVQELEAKADQCCRRTTNQLKNLMEVTLIEKHNSLKMGASISIRPFVDSSADNMGLQRYNMSVFENCFHEEPLICLENNGIKRYVTGLNEFAPELKDLDNDEREAAIKQIRITVAQLEKELASNVIDPADKEFWNKVKLLRPDNDVFWEKIIMRFGNDPIFLDPAKDPYDLIKMRAIEAGGFSMVAKSLEEARTSGGGKKFYLDKYEETASIRTEVKKLRNKALAELQKLYDKNANKLFYVCKIVDPNSTQYRKTTPLDVLYDNMDKYINGETVDKDKKKTAQRFLDVVALDMETLKLRAIVKDASLYKFIATRGDGFIYHMKSATMIGKNPSDVVEYLKNPLNEEILTDLTKNVEKMWNN
jgi:hypothetical protein